MTARFRIFALLIACVGAMAIVAPASAQNYPNRPVRWVVPYPPGGATDIMARLIGHRLSEKLGQQFVIENQNCQHCIVQQVTPS
jgi:tripartite-type tricarboxylate transporter receptor subunit TctC